jgi:putative nucleotidyltransferase with HDIG domain
MSLKPSLEEQERLADTLRLADSRLPATEWLTEAVFSLAFLGAVAGVWALDPPGHLSVLPVVFAVITMVCATRVRFDTPFGFTVATQLAFVPLLFAMPVAVVPLAVVLAMMLARLPELVAGDYLPSRLIKEIGNSWFSIGAVGLFAITGTRPDQAGPLLLFAALLAQFTVDFAASAIRIGIQRAATLAEQLRDCWIYGVDAALSSLALVVGEDIHRTAVVALAPLPMLALLAVFAHERHQRMSALVELNEAYHGTAWVLGDVVEADDGYTGEHSKSVVRVALTVADELGLSAERRRNLEFGALLHDVGKIAIPKEIINKPDKLDEREWQIITTHTVEGQKMLDRIGGFMREVGQIVRSHHERWDGGGYPDGLIGEAIPLESRIITCCDSWNAMRTNRPYRRALSREVARVELEANAGRQFDPQVVAAFLRAIDIIDPEPRDVPAIAPPAPAPAPAAVAVEPQAAPAAPGAPAAPVGS